MLVGRDRVHRRDRFVARRAWGARCGLLAGSALLYLAAMDITFDIENGLYGLVPHSPPMQFELLINAWSLALGIADDRHVVEACVLNPHRFVDKSRQKLPNQSNRNIAVTLH